MMFDIEPDVSFFYWTDKYIPAVPNFVSSAYISMEDKSSECGE